MRIIVSGRRVGKTHRMIEWLRHHPDRVAVVINEAERDRLIKLYDVDHPDSGLDRSQFISFYQARSGVLYGREATIAIDNLDMMLRDMFGHPVEIVTMTGRAET